MKYFNDCRAAHESTIYSNILQGSHSSGLTIKLGGRPPFCTFFEKNVFEWILCSKFVTSISDDIEKMHFKQTFLGIVKVNFAIQVSTYFKKYKFQLICAIKIFGFYGQKTHCGRPLCLRTLCLRPLWPRPL